MMVRLWGKSKSQLQMAHLEQKKYMRKTCLAVARVWIKDMDIPFSSYEQIPVNEMTDTPHMAGHGLHTPDEYIEWSRDGTTKRVRENDTTIWWPKPTLADAVKLKRKGEFWQFNKDGSVYVRDGDGVWFWSADFEVEAPRRSYVGPDGYTYSDEKVWYSDMIPMMKEEFLRWDDEDKDNHTDSCDCGNSYRCCGYDSRN